MKTAGWPGLVALLLLATALARANPISPLIINPHNHHSYLLLDAATWKDSEAQAVTLGGHLATVRNKAEEDWIFKMFGAYGGQQRLLWIGLSDIPKKFHYSWSSGESVSYTDWAPGEPNNAGPHGEDYAAIYYPNHSQANQWNDWADRTTDPIGLPMNGVVEITPPQASSAATNGNNFIVVQINPALIITNNAGSIQLEWSLSAGDYVLEATPSLAEPFTWFGYSETTNLELGVITVQITNPAPQMFFRLYKP
jgi:hypothetical protein